MKLEMMSVYKQRDFVRVELSKPDHLNAINLDFLSDLEQVSQMIEEDSAIRAVIINGTGKAFCAGADLHQVSGFESLTEIMSFNERINKVFYRWERLSRPIIAAVNGLALGGGLELALLCDFILAVPKAKFGLPEINIGVMPGAGGTQRLARAIGFQRARTLLLTGDTIDSSKALDYGLIYQVIGEDCLLQEAESLASILAAKPALSVKYIKDALLTGFCQNKAIDYEGKVFGLVFMSDDRREGMKAFKEKKPPVFKEIPY